MKSNDIYTTICMTVSAVVGAGFVGGKEPKLFFDGKIWAVAIFSIGLLLALLCLQNFCKQHSVNGLVDLAQKLFGRGYLVYLWVVSLSTFCVVVALFGTSADCLKTLFGDCGNLPIYQFATGAICFVVLRLGKQSIEMASKILLPICIAFMVCAYAFSNKQSNSLGSIEFDSCIVYCLFNFVPMLSIFAKNKVSKRAIVAGVGVLAIITAMQVVTASRGSSALPTIDAIASSRALYHWGIASVYLSGVVGILLCSMPICQLLGQVLDDDTTSTTVALCVAVSLSNFGFDKTVALCYPAVAVVGLVTLVVILSKSTAKRKGKVALASSKRKIKKEKIKKIKKKIKKKIYITPTTSN